MTVAAWCVLIGFVLMLVAIITASVFMRGAAEVPLPPPIVTPPDYITRSDLEHVVDQLRPLVPHVTVPEREPDPPPPVVLPPPLVAVPRPEPPPVPVDTRKVQIRYVDERGRVVGTSIIDRRQRRHQMVYVHGRPKRKGIFIAERELSGVWIYRQVGDDGLA
jgi:hypothetical protein